MALVQHMVVVRFKRDVDEASIQKMFHELSRLQQVIPGIKYFAGGPYSSPEGMNGGFTHGFLITFESPAARNVYLTHPEHERVKNMILPTAEAAVAFDFEVDSAR